ncbi:hypothetical protein [Clostridium guangxiense]|uniref:hypothetical protein n=1 Tax=Clostridium guangxiense TaxID=1662055 RepID=UPI001E5C1A52|nr:hypothetical protein [Clostridium guangxiense]MCD2346238.1 hypothetical protein [Clostridium guangxiense]
MNLENLELNKKYKNYKELCEVLDEPIKGGKSKQLQLQDWERYFKYTKQGNGFIVTEIYAEPKEKIDNRGKSKGSHGNNNKYAQYTDKLIENFLYNKQELHHEYIVYITNSCLAQMIKMVNFNYRVCECNRNKFHKFLYTTYQHNNWLAENDLFYCMHNKIKPALLGALNRLQNADKLKYTLTYLVAKDGDIEPMNDIDIDFVKETEEDVLQEMGIKKQQLINNIPLRMEYYKKINDRVMEYFDINEIDIDGFWQGYKIVVKNVQEQKNVKKLEKEFNNIFSKEVVDYFSVERTKERVKKKQERHKILGCNKYDNDRITSLIYHKTIENCVRVVLDYKALNIVNKIEGMEDPKKQLQEADYWAKELGLTPNSQENNVPF